MSTTQQPEPVPGATPGTGSAPWISAAAFARHVDCHRSTVTRFIAVADTDPDQPLDVHEDPYTGRRTYRLDQLEALWAVARHQPGPARRRGEPTAT